MRKWAAPVAVAAAPASSVFLKPYCANYFLDPKLRAHLLISAILIFSKFQTNVIQIFVY